jgi:hypothetical protein
MVGPLLSQNWNCASLFADGFNWRVRTERTNKPGRIGATSRRHLSTVPMVVTVKYDDGMGFAIVQVFPQGPVPATDNGAGQ